MARLNCRVLVWGLCPIALTGSFLLWHCVARQGSARAAPGTPSLFVDNPARDLGTALPGETLQLEYRVQNRGAGVLAITDLRTSCGCSPASLDTDRVPAGGAAVVRVSFRLPTTAGRVTHAVLFSTNDPEKPDVRLPFSALAQRPIDVTPASLYAGLVMSGGQISLQVELCSNDGAPFEVKAVSTSVRWLQVEPVPAPRGARHAFRVTLLGQAPAGPFAESISFVTSSAREPRLQVPVCGEIVDGFRLSPPVLMLRSAAPGTVVEASLLVRAVETRVSAALSVSAEASDWKVLSWTLQKAAGKTAVLHLRIQVPSTPGYRRASLLVRRAPETRPQRIPVSCVVLGDVKTPR